MGLSATGPTVLAQNKKPKVKMIDLIFNVDLTVRALFKTKLLDSVHGNKAMYTVFDTGK